MSIKFHIVLSIIFLFEQGAMSQSSSWTRFRGTDGSGIDNTIKLPLLWDKQDYKWESKLPGSGNGSPVVWEETIFVSSASDSSRMGHLLAIDSRDGRILWQEDLALSNLSMHRDNKLATASPAADDSQVYTVWYTTDKTIICAYSHEGSLKWKSTYPGIEAQHGGGSSLMLTDKSVVFTREQEKGSSVSSSWVAVDKTTGLTAWELERESASRNSFSTPLLVETESGEAQLIFTSMAHGFTGVHPETGQILWERANFLNDRVVASPVYSDGLIVASAKDGATVLRADLNTNQVEDTVLYTLPVSQSSYVPSPLASDDLLFFFRDNGSISCIRLATGELLWKERPAGAMYGSPVMVDGFLYCITKDGKVPVIKAGSSYILEGISDLGEGSFSTPVLCPSGMVFRTFTGIKLLGKN